jgi:hypothetical protein
MLDVVDLAKSKQPHKRPQQRLSPLWSMDIFFLDDSIMTELGPMSLTSNRRSQGFDATSDKARGHPCREFDQMPLSLLYGIPTVSVLTFGALAQ